jgi:hypothetical protein
LPKKASFGRIIVNQHKNSRVFLYSFNTLSFSERYCILFLYQYNRDNKRKEMSRTEGLKNGEKVIRQRKARSAQNTGGQTNGSI